MSYKVFNGKGKMVGVYPGETKEAAIAMAVKDKESEGFVNVPVHAWTAKIFCSRFVSRENVAYFPLLQETIDEMLERGDEHIESTIGGYNVSIEFLRSITTARVSEAPISYAVLG